MQTRKLTLAALLIAIGTLTAHVVYIPAGVSRCFPVQHAINVMAAVLLGADYATAVGFVIACLRNMFGTGSILAFPGSIVGACLAGLLYQRHKTLSMAIVGEIFGTGVLGGFLAWVIAYFILGSKAVAWFFIPPFLISSIGGSLIALALLKSGVFQNIIALNKK
jgi:energy coupling factor transporter S component ThiW